MEYIKKPLSIESIDMLYNANNVRYENAVVYSDFSLSLINLVLNTYLGDDLTKGKDKRKHFEWCWDKVISNFKKEQIDLKPSEELKEYYHDFLQVAFYENQEKEDDEKIALGIIKYWREIFDIQTVKTRAEVDVFLEVYKLFNSQLFQKK